MARRTLVTGAGGFVGANLVRRLLADGHEVHALLRPGSSPWRLPTVTAGVVGHQVDLCDGEAVRRIVASVRPEWVFHLAARGAYSWQTDVSEILTVNAIASALLFDACVEAGVEAIVHAGSSSEYGFKDHAPDEREWIEPNSPYAVGKAAATLYGRQLARRTEARITTLRLYSAYGPWEEPNRLMPTLVLRGLRGELPPLVDPAVARDFVYVDDVCDAFVRAARSETLAPGAVLNVGSGRQTSIGEIVEIARRQLGIAAEPRWSSMPDRVWDTSVWVADVGRIERELGWRAQTSVETGLERMIAWVRESGSIADFYAERIAAAR